MSKKSNQQFRPYLTAAELSHLLTLLTLSAEKGVPASTALLKKLKVFAYKIEHEIISPSATLSTSPRTSANSLESLGASVDETRYLSGEMTPEEEAEYLIKLMTSGV